MLARSVIRAPPGAILVAAALASVLAACTPERRTGPTVRFDIAADPSNLDPLFGRPDPGGIDATLARLLFEPFFDLDARGRLVPALVREVPTVANGGLSRDGRRLVYHLRPGVRWSDGVPVSARDVLFTLHAILDPRNPLATRAGYDLIESARALDARTVELRLRRAWAPAVATFFCGGAVPQYVLPAHLLANEDVRGLAQAAFNAAPTVGDGPFRFVSWQRGDRIVYAANPRYWRGPPKVARVVVRIVADPQTNLVLLRAGTLDFNLVAPAQWAALARLHAPVRRRDVPTALIAGLAFNLRHAPLDERRMREAIAKAIDRREIVRAITLGAYPLAQSDRPRFSWAYDPRVAEPAFDPAGADRDLAAAGWRRGPDGTRRKDGRELALVYAEFPESDTGVRVATYVQQALAQRGIRVEIKTIAASQLFAPAAEGGVLARGGFDLAYVPWAMGNDPDDRFLLGCRGEQNAMHYCDPNVDRLEALAVRTSERARRAAFYHRIDRIVARDLPILYLFNPSYVYAYRPALEGFAPNPFIATAQAWRWRLAPRAVAGAAARAGGRRARRLRIACGWPLTAGRRDRPTFSRTSAPISRTCEPRSPSSRSAS
ncbi:MAG: peptide ABC transporter substrate-binding protein [Vulcanimicrobiaceae bacterium]